QRCDDVAVANCEIAPAMGGARGRNHAGPVAGDLLCRWGACSHTAGATLRSMDHWPHSWTHSRVLAHARHDPTDRRRKRGAIIPTSTGGDRRGARAGVYYRETLGRAVHHLCFVESASNGGRNLYPATGTRPSGRRAIAESDALRDKVGHRCSRNTGCDAARKQIAQRVRNEAILIGGNGGDREVRLFKWFDSV